jgi:hypothetical protein
MKQWLSYLFGTYFHALGAAVFFTALVAVVFAINTMTAFLLILIGSTAIFITRILLHLEDGKIDHIFAGEK